MKKNVLFMVAALLLCGAVSAQNWGTPDAHAKSSNTPIVARVTVDGNAVTPTVDYRLGAFVGEELRGLAAPHTEDNNFWIQVFYNQGTSETISFKLYDGTNEYTTCSVTKATQEEGWGTPTQPVVLDFASTQIMTQTTALAAGWNWWSTPIEMNGVDGLTMLEEALGNEGIRIQSQSNFIDFYDIEGYTFWDGQLNDITNEQMYKIRMSADNTISLTGIAANPSNHPIAITSGWNWIGYPCGSSASLEDAFSGFTPENNDVIKGANSFAQFYNIEGFTFWDGALTTLTPGQGYMYKSNSSSNKTLTFQNRSKGELAEDVSSSGEMFKAIGNDFANNMTITALIELDGENLHSDNYELAAFVGNECRGSVKIKYVRPLDQYLAFLLVHGDREESLRFVLTDGTEITWSTDLLMYVNDATYGTPTEPVVLHFGPMGVNQNNVVLVNFYPNPTHDVFNIEGEDILKIDIINAFGQIVYSKENNNNSIQIDLSRHSIGVYLVRVVTNKGVVTQQIIKE